MKGVKENYTVNMEIENDNAKHARSQDLIASHKEANEGSHRHLEALKRGFISLSRTSVLLS